ncbi:predicted protein [Verticillium alfalfae VaMs.102]|uniref:Predicted protein n=1 Tax=Verticillium alfalfae (strain VaMs.102 / ATCC MYA-4576 / FGSC 10136) TaxID=526221 RepID=C9SGV6_VERA1|nr:predicted protein [Verticillium alfalfae VaMs.102]EEY17578.1 predicted protein [Verticillium alfalfae VaMs.102]
MRGIEVKEYVKGPKELKVTDLPDPTPKKDEYLIQVHAAATNFFDILQIQGKYQNQPRMFLAHMSFALDFLMMTSPLTNPQPSPWVAGAEFAGHRAEDASRLPSRLSSPSARATLARPRACRRVSLLPY